MNNFARVIREQLDIDINISGAGAAGGLAGGAVAFMNAKLTSGINAIMDLIGLDRKIADADWIITGEGCFDSQSLQGKVVSGIVNIAKKTPIVILAGDVKLAPCQYSHFGIVGAIPARQANMPLDVAIANRKKLLSIAAVKFIDEYII